MDVSTVQSIKLALVAATGLSKDTLHVYVGLAVLLTAAALWRKPLRSLVPWLTVLAVAVLGEIIDLADGLSSGGLWLWSASVHDIVNTLFWPSVLLALARYTRLFAPPTAAPSRN
jgi:uncharacterized membrane protein YqgA involved in biofilm formation